MNHEKRRLPRFHITPCQFHDDARSKNFSVQDISKGGLAIRLVDRLDLEHFAVSSIHTGMVKVEGKKLAGQFQVKFIRGTLIGAEWVNPSSELLNHLESISHPEHLGLQLRKFDLPDFSGTEWFHNPVGVDFLVYSENGNEALARWTLYIHHSFVQWEADTGVQTGQALAEDEEGYAHGIVRLETRLIEYDQRPDLTLVNAAKELLNHAPIDRMEIKDKVLSHLNGVV
jgi:hypothetical protein